MKYIVNLTDETLIIGGMTIGQHQKTPVINPEILEWPDTKTLLSQGKIRIEGSAEEPESSQN